jgi:TMEM175 potassium channel family protein
MWINHLTVLDQIDRVNRTFLMLSVLFLMLVAFVPFPTRLVAEHLRDNGARAAAVAYGITFTLTALLYNTTWLYASRGNRLIRADADPRMISGITRSFFPGTFIYGGSTIVAAISPIAGVILFAGVATFYVIESSFFGRDDG